MDNTATNNHINYTTMEKKRVYISGPMDGIEFDNREEFIRANKWITEQNQEPINPFKLALEQDRTRAFSQLPAANYAQRLAFDIKAMAEYAEAVCVLPGWESSKGASLEVAFAVNVMGIPVYEAYTNKPVSLDVIVTNEESEAIQTMEQLLNACKIVETSAKTDPVGIMDATPQQLAGIITEFVLKLNTQAGELHNLKNHKAATELHKEWIFLNQFYLKLKHFGDLSEDDRDSIRGSLKHAYKIYSLAIDPPPPYRTGSSCKIRSSLYTYSVEDYNNGTESSQAVASERS